MIILPPIRHPGNEKPNGSTPVAACMNSEQIIALFFVGLMVLSMLAYSATLI
ncbi:hypothetical protein [Halovenus sp. HT40]|uniref:hypothetical protein n=1 Tax=Halovenus sp. HT40 TaxID=3126691 RepID=UPI00300EAED3